MYRLSFSLIVGLINHNLRVPVGMGIDPGRLLLLNVDAAMTAVAGERFVAAHIVVRELRAGAEVDAPPRIVDEVAAPVIENGVVDWRVRIPVGRTFRLGRQSPTVFKAT